SPFLLYPFCFEALAKLSIRRRMRILPAPFSLESAQRKSKDPSHQLLFLQTLTKPFSRNPFLLIFIQNARGWGIPLISRLPLFPPVADMYSTPPLFSMTFALFSHSFSKNEMYLSCFEYLPYSFFLEK